MSIWTDDKIKLLAILKSEGWNARQMAAAIGTTRGAVLGKIDRLGEQIRDYMTDKPSGFPKPSAQEPGLRKSVWKRPTAPVPTDPMPAADPVVQTMPVIHAGDGRPITLMRLQSHSCRWPTNNGRPEFYFCGRHKLDDSPYCEEHASKAYARKMKTDGE